MALKESGLYSSLWASCDELRGGMDASQYKDYVLVLAKSIGIHEAKTSAATTVHDPTCGSGSLLLKVGDEAGTPVIALRAGKGRRHQRPGADEHDPAR